MDTDSHRTVLWVGFWASLVALVGALGYLASAFLQVFGVLAYREDSILGYGSSLLMPVPVLVAMLALHAITPERLRFWSSAAVAFAVVYTTYNTLNYVVQLATVLPAGYSWSFQRQAGTQGPLSLLNQTPHSLFWDVDGLGYIFLNLATVFAIPLFGRTGPDRWVRRFFIANGLITPLFATTYFAPTYSVPILLLGSPWGVTVPGCLIVLALFFRRRALASRTTRSQGTGPAIT
jgi:hypothetical protein